MTGIPLRNNSVVPGSNRPKTKEGWGREYKERTRETDRERGVRHGADPSRSHSLRTRSKSTDEPTVVVFPKGTERS